MLTNELISDAMLLVLVKHKEKHSERKLRAPTSLDYERIKEAATKIALEWSQYQSDQHEGPRKKYHGFRTALLDRWQKEHCWHVRTRNLYGSVLSTLKNWEMHGVSKADQDLLETLRPGATLFLQFLDGYEERLL